MKKLILPLALVFLGLNGLAGPASAARLEVQVDGPRLALYRGDRQLSYDIERLNRQLRIVRSDLRVYRAGGRLRGEFNQVARATERLNFHFRRGIGSRREMRSRANALRADLLRIQRQLRVRTIGPRYFR